MAQTLAPGITLGMESALRRVGKAVEWNLEKALALSIYMVRSGNRRCQSFNGMDGRWGPNRAGRRVATRPSYLGSTVSWTPREPSLPMAITWYGRAPGPSIPGEPIGMPGTARPWMSGRSSSRRRMTWAGTWPSTT
jgi:hypothetical protein